MVNLTAKKVYCPKCKKLSKIKSQQPTGGKNQFTCIKCASVIWKKDGLKWTYLRAE